MSAPTPVVTTLVDSYDDIIVKVTIPNGGDADIAATLVIDISTFTNGRTATSCKLKRVQWSLDGFSARLFEDASTDVPLVALAAGTGDLKFPFPIPMTGASGTTGDVMFTTLGVGTGDTGHFIVHATKESV